MTRKQFLNDLYLRLAALGPEQAEQHLTYYAEMLADRMEEGMSEEEAVASMEDVETIARRILEEEGLSEGTQPVEPPAYPDASRIPGGGGTRAYQPQKKWNRRKLVGAVLWAAAIVAIVGAVGRYANDRRADRTTVTEVAPVREDAVEQVTDTSSGESYYRAGPGEVLELQPDQVQSVSIRCSAGSVRVEESPDGIIRYYSEKGTMGWQLEGGHLSVSPAGNNAELVVCCPSGLLEQLEVSTVSANVMVDYMDVGSLEIATISGDVDLYSFYADSIGLASTSGDIYLSNVQTGALNMRNTSGEIDFYGGSAVECRAETISGGIDLELISSANEVYASSTSGDMELTLDIGTNYVSCVTKSGDVDLKLPEDEGFTLLYTTISGDVESGLPLARSGDSYTYGSGGPCTIEVQTTSGDVEIQTH